MYRLFSLLPLLASCGIINSAWNLEQEGDIRLLETRLSLIEGLIVRDSAAGRAMLQSDTPAVTIELPAEHWAADTTATAMPLTAFSGPVLAEFACTEGKEPPALLASIMRRARVNPDTSIVEFDRMPDGEFLIVVISRSEKEAFDDSGQPRPRYYSGKALIVDGQGSIVYLAKTSREAIRGVRTDARREWVSRSGAGS